MFTTLTSILSIIVLAKQLSIIEIIPGKYLHRRIVWIVKFSHAGVHIILLWTPGIYYKFVLSLYIACYCILLQLWTITKRLQIRHKENVYKWNILFVTKQV